MSFITGVCLATFLASSTADGVTTHYALARGAVESNPILVNQSVMIGVKVGTAAATVYAVKKYERENKWSTRILLIAGTAFYTGLAVHNYGVYQRQR